MSLKALSLGSPLNASLEDVLLIPTLLLEWGSGSELTQKRCQASTSGPKFMTHTKQTLP